MISLHNTYSDEVHSGKNIKPLCCSSLILKQTICLAHVNRKQTRSQHFFRDLNRNIALQSPYMQIRVKLFVLTVNATKHLNLQNSNHPVKINDPNRRDAKGKTDDRTGI